MREDGLTMETVHTGKVQVIENTERERERINPYSFDYGVRAAICLPLELQGKRIGGVWVCYDEPRGFSEDEIQGLQLYVNQASIAYGRARRIRELRYLHQAAHKLASAAGLEEVLQQIVASARQVLDADSAAIWPYDAVRNQFQPGHLVADGIPPELLDQFKRDELQEGGTAEAVMERSYLAVTDARDPQYAFLGSGGRGLRGKIDARAFQGIALRVGERMLGVLYVNYQRPRAFGPEHQETLETFAAHAALTLSRAQLLDQVSRAQVAASAAARMSVVGDLNQTLKAIVEGTRDTVHCDAISLYTYDQGTQTLGYPPTLLGVWYPGQVTLLPHMRPDSVVYPMLRRDEPYISDNIPTDPNFMHRRFSIEEQIKSCIVVPLKVGDRRVGVLFVNYRTPHRFTPDEVAYITLFADQAAVAIRNAQLFDELRKTKSMVGARTALMWMGMASSAWRHSIEGCAVNIRNAIALLRLETSPHPGESAWQGVQDTLDQIDGQARLILDKPITPPLSPEKGVDVFTINDLVRERMRQLGRTAPYQKVEMRLEFKPEADVGVRASPDWLRRALDLVSDNAVEAMERTSKRRLSVTTYRVGERVEVAIADTGPGIPPEIQARLFGARSESDKGLGMGLLMVQAILQTYGGDVRLESSDARGTTMVLWLPIVHQDTPQER
jgi:GAF domain-containing protein